MCTASSITSLIIRRRFEKSTSYPAKQTLALFAIQLALNSLWPVLFFGLQNPGAASVEIILLWAAILTTLIAFWKRSKWAGGFRRRIWRE